MSSGEAPSGRVWLRKFQEGDDPAGVMRAKRAIGIINFPSYRD
jgi:hypothetical protein